MNSNWFEIEHMMRHRQDELLKVAADLQRSGQVRRARAEADGPGTRIVLLGPQRITLAARLGRALVAVGERLQGTSA